MFFSCVRCAKQKWVVYFTNLLKYLYTSPGFAGCSCTYRNNAGSLHVECHRLMLTPIPTQCEWTASVICVCLLFFIVFLVILENCSLKLRLIDILQWGFISFPYLVVQGTLVLMVSTEEIVMPHLTNWVCCDWDSNPLSPACDASVLSLHHCEY